MIDDAMHTAPRPASRARVRPALGVLASLGALVVLRLVFWLAAPPNSDEAYYWAWGLHPALSYLDHPPLHAWTQGLFHALLGRSLLVLRLPAAATTVGTIWLVARMARRLSGAREGGTVTVAAVVLASPLFLMFTSFAWQDHLLIFVALLSASLFLDVLAAESAGERAPTWKVLATGATLGLAGLAKYNAIFLGLGFAVALAWDARARRLLRDPRVWAAVAIAVAVVAPVLVWNAEHGLASFRLQTADRMHYRFLGPIGAVHFAGPTLLFLSPVLAWAMVRGASRAACARSEYGAGLRRLALAVFACSTAAFLVLSLFTWILYYWNVVAYLLLLPPAARWLGERPRLLRWHLGYGVVAAVVMVVHGAVIPLSALVPGVRDEDSKEVYGWSEVAAAVRAELRAGERVVANDYRPGSHLEWALGGPDVVVMSVLPSEFDYWPEARLRPGDAAVLVADRCEPLRPSARCRFARTTLVGTVPVVRLGVKLKEYELWRGEGFRGPDWPAACNAN